MPCQLYSYYNFIIRCLKSLLYISFKLRRRYRRYKGTLLYAEKFYILIISFHPDKQSPLPLIGKVKLRAKVIRRIFFRKEVSLLNYDCLSFCYLQYSPFYCFPFAYPPVFLFVYLMVILYSSRAAQRRPALKPLSVSAYSVYASCLRQGYFPSRPFVKMR